MALVGFNFDKMSIERKDEIKGKVNIKSNIDILEFKKSDVSLDPNKETIKITFTFFIIYEPDFAKVEFKGHVLILEDPKVAKKLLEDWKKKKVDPKLREELYNLILRRSNIKALALEEDLNLIPHWPMPTVKVEEEK
jgi:hypothetical protein